MKTGIEIIAEERLRQINEEGWTAEHDDKHGNDHLAVAAARYAAPMIEEIGMYWPWDQAWWKPTPNDRIRELAKAGALIAAEIDRLVRLNNNPDDVPVLQRLETMILAEKHRNDVMRWEQEMGILVGGDSVESARKEIKTIIGQRDTAWAENREVRKAIGADENEPTIDEVKRFVKKSQSTIKRKDMFFAQIMATLPKGHGEINISIDRAWDIAKTMEARAIKGEESAGGWF